VVCPVIFTFFPSFLAAVSAETMSGCSEAGVADGFSA
jgi:hypothetical protein